MSGVNIIRSLHVKREKKSGDSNFYSLVDMYTDHNEGKKPTWQVFDKQVCKLLFVKGKSANLIFTWQIYYIFIFSSILEFNIRCIL